MRALAVVSGLGIFIALAITGFLAVARNPVIAAIEPPARSFFDAAMISSGARLAAIGNCETCHTKDGGQAFAGGRPLSTPFGTIHSTNITPDAETGIGRWSEAAFFRALREGIDREGRHLYPAFPYVHFNKVTDEDGTALYDFMMTRDPVSAVAPPNRLIFPFNIRPLLFSGSCSSLTRADYNLMRPNARNGIAAPTWWNASGIAAPVIRRSTFSVARRDMRNSPAANPKAGMPQR